MPADTSIHTNGDGPRLLRLQGAVQHYGWGGYDFIPNLLGLANPDRRPFAELWIGAHITAPALAVVDGGTVPLSQLTAARPDAILGADAAERFAGQLPYLLKVLDARQMLSIQAHPSKAQAEDGFERESVAGIEPGAATRNYRDDNHKPEVHVALTEFWMLHGFRPLEEISEVLRATPELQAVMPSFDKKLAAARRYDAERRDLLRALYSSVMTMPQSSVDTILDPLIARLEASEPLDKSTPDYWALKAARSFPLPDGHRDRGIFSIYLLNLVHLQPGQGTYQPAGMLHAYLEGVNVELMANSDNVLRGGLTPKHVDVPELMRTLSFESGKPGILDGERVSDTETVYRTDAREFELSRISVAPGQVHSAPADHGPDSLIVTDGSGVVRGAGLELKVERGGIVFAPAGTGYEVKPGDGGITVFRAAVPEAGMV